MLGNVFGLLAGLSSQVIIASIFGAGASMDAFLTALVVPTYLQAVLLSGLPFVFVPAFVHSESAGDIDNAWSLAGTFFWLVGGVLTILAIAGSMFAWQIVHI